MEVTNLNFVVGPWHRPSRDLPGLLSVHSLPDEVDELSDGHNILDV
jgi:hypothetical protein